MTTRIIYLLLLCAAASAQSESLNVAEAGESAVLHSDREQMVSGRPIPVPFLSFGPALMKSGYAPFAYRAEAGLSMEATHIVLDALAAYDDGRKVDDNDQPNPKGHDRYFESGIYCRPARPGWTQMFYLGGGGYDLMLRSCSECRRDYSMRIEMNWETSGSDWQSGSHGPETNLTWPSPREKRHWFYHNRFGIYRYHETVTEPSNLLLARQQLSTKGFNGVLEFGVIYRF